MGYVVRMPQMGMEMEEGVIIEWAIEEGASIEEDERLLTVESEKASNDVEARETGTLRRVLVSEGEAVPPGTAIGIVAGQDEDLETYEAQIETESSEETLETTDTTMDEVSETPNGEAGSTDHEPDGVPGDEPDSEEAEKIRAAPGARNLAAEHNVSLTSVTGTGPEGVITESDVRNHLESQLAESPRDITRTVSERRELTSVQKTVAERLGESYRSAVHVTVDREVPTESLQSVVSAADNRGIDISLTDLLLKAVGAQMAAHPEFNALVRTEEESLILELIEEINVSLAVDIDAGLVTPVIPSVGDSHIEDIADTRRKVTQRALDDEYTTEDLSGGTFTVSNLGMLGIDSFDAVINPPQVAILGVGRIRDDGRMTMSLTFDHRVVNGADAARFMNDLAETVTDVGTLVSFFEGSLFD